MTVRKSLQCRASSKAVLGKNVLSPLFPVGGVMVGVGVGGAVDTNF